MLGVQGGGGGGGGGGVGEGEGREFLHMVWIYSPEHKAAPNII